MSGGEGKGLRRVGPYEVVGELARGGMGVVLRARAPDGRDVAIKVLLHGPLSTASQRERFRTEARAVQRLAHPGIIAVLDVGEEGSLPFFVMELVPGVSLQARLEREGPLPDREAARLALVLARALEHAHAQGVIHRDVKPQNVLLRPARGGPEPLLGDFGLAKDEVAATAALTSSGQFLGTAHFVAPEQARGERRLVGPQADVYSLGATLYAMLAGEPPFTEHEGLQALAAAVETDPVPPSRKRRGVDPALEAICLRAMARDPAARPHGAGALALELERWLARAGRSKRPVPRPVVFGAVVLVASGALLVALDRVRAHLEREQPPAGGHDDRAGGDAALEARVVLEAGRLLAAQRDRLGAAADALAGDAPLTAEGGRALRAARRDAHERAAGADALEGSTDLELAAVQALVAARGRATSDRAVARWVRAAGDAAAVESAVGALATRRDPVALSIVRDALVALDAPAALSKTVGRALAADDLPLDDPLLLALRAQQRRARGDRVGAARDVERALARDPLCAVARVVRSTFRREDGDPAGALADVRAAERDQDWGALRCEEGRALAALRDLESARASFEQAVELAPWDPSVWAARGAFRLDAGDVPGAVEDASRAAKVDRTFVPAWRLRASARRQIGDLRGARDDLDRVVALSQDDADGWQARAELLRELGDDAAAILDYGRVLELDPTRGLAWLIRGNLRAYLGDHAGGLDDLDRAAALLPDDPLVAVGQAQACMFMGDDARAVVHYTRAIALQPNFVAHLFRRAAVYERLGEHARAADDYGAAIAIAPAAPSAWQGRARCRLALGDSRGAVDDMTGLLERRPGTPEALVMRATARQAHGDLAGAVADLEALIGVGPSAERWMLLARARLRVSNEAGALEACDRALELEPWADAYALRGALRVAAGEWTAAQADASAALAILARLSADDRARYAPGGLARAVQVRVLARLGVRARLLAR